MRNIELVGQSGEQVFEVTLLHKGHVHIFGRNGEMSACGIPDHSYPKMRGALA